MSGQTTQVAQNSPDVFQYATYSVHNYATLAADTAWIYADRNMVIDSFIVGVSAVSTTATSTVKLVKTAGGATGSSTSPTAFALTATSLATANAVAISSAVALTATGTTSATIVTTANIVDAGNWIGLCLNTPQVAGAGNTLVGSIQIRFRTRLA